MDRLQAVADIRQGAGGNDRHRVLDEGLAHLVAELLDLERAAVLVGLAGVHAGAGVAEFLLELAVVIVVRIVAGLGLVVDVRALVRRLGAVEQAPEVLRQGLAVARRAVVVLVCHLAAFL